MNPIVTVTRKARNRDYFWSATLFFCKNRKELQARRVWLGKKCRVRVEEIHNLEDDERELGFYQGLYQKNQEERLCEEIDHWLSLVAINHYKQSNDEKGIMDFGFVQIANDDDED